MRRKDRQTTLEVAHKILRDSNYGILATTCENGYPHSVALNHVFLNGYIYFHCAKEGLKLDNILYDNKVCFTTVSEANIIESAYATKYKSAIVYGKAYIVEDVDEFKSALYEIARRYTKDFVAKAKTHIAAAINKTTVVRIEIDDIKGKVNN
ncbi:pyridoxamine 5'-phosphate oxidase family protein [Mycoplasmatota bacterium zrk1]